MLNHLNAFYKYVFSCLLNDPFLFDKIYIKSLKYIFICPNHIPFSLYTNLHQFFSFKRTIWAKTSILIACLLHLFLHIIIHHYLIHQYYSVSFFFIIMIFIKMARYVWWDALPYLKFRCIIFNIFCINIALFISFFLLSILYPYLRGFSYEVPYQWLLMDFH